MPFVAYITWNSVFINSKILGLYVLHSFNLNYILHTHKNIIKNVRCWWISGKRELSVLLLLSMQQLLTRVWAPHYHKILNIKNYIWCIGFWRSVKMNLVTYNCLVSVCSSMIQFMEATDAGGGSVIRSWVMVSSTRLQTKLVNPDTRGGYAWVNPATTRADHPAMCCPRQKIGLCLNVVCNHWSALGR